MKEKKITGYLLAAVILVAAVALLPFIGSYFHWFMRSAKLDNLQDIVVTKDTIRICSDSENLNGSNTGCAITDEKVLEYVREQEYIGGGIGGVGRIEYSFQIAGAGEAYVLIYFYQDWSQKATLTAYKINIAEDRTAAVEKVEARDGLYHAIKYDEYDDFAKQYMDKYGVSREFFEQTRHYFAEENPE